MKPAQKITAAKKSMGREHTCHSGTISRGKYVFVTMFRYVMRLSVPLATEFEKKNQGTSAAYAKIGYGTPSDGIFATRENTIVKTIIADNGCTIAHAMPKNDWL